MINFNSLNIAATFTVGLFILGISMKPAPASTYKTLIVQAGTAKDLENLEQKSDSEQLWQVGGQEPGGDDNSELDYQIRKSDNLFDSGEVDPTAQQWENQNSGDSKKNAGTIPLIGF